jgi:hypothetical protein
MSAENGEERRWRFRVCRRFHGNRCPSRNADKKIIPKCPQMSRNVPKCPLPSKCPESSGMQVTTEASENTTVAPVIANPVEVATEEETARQRASLRKWLDRLGEAWLPTFPNTIPAAALLPLRISQRCIPAIRHESRQRFPSVPWAMPPRREEPRTRDPADPGRCAQPRSRCPVCVSCRWPASRGCAAACSRHSLP